MQAYAIKVNFVSFARSTSDFPNFPNCFCVRFIFANRQSWQSNWIFSYVPHSHHLVDHTRKIDQTNWGGGQVHNANKGENQMCPNNSWFLRLPEFLGAGGQCNHRFRWKLDVSKIFPKCLFKLSNVCYQVQCYIKHILWLRAGAQHRCRWKPDLAKLSECFPLCFQNSQCLISGATFSVESKQRGKKRHLCPFQISIWSSYSIWDLQCLIPTTFIKWHKVSFFHSDCMPILINITLAKFRRRCYISTCLACWRNPNMRL